jgi:hypothetical protein
MPVHQQGTNANTAVARTAVVRLLQEGGSPAKLDVSGQDLRGITLINGHLEGADLSQARICEANLCGAKLSKADLHGADLSWAALGGASTFEQTRSHLRRRGALFREKTNVMVAERFSEKVGRYALGCALGLPGMSVVGFLMVLGVRFIFTQTRLKRQPVEHGDATRRWGV